MEKEEGLGPCRLTARGTSIVGPGFQRTTCEQGQTTKRSKGPSSEANEKKLCSGALVLGTFIPSTQFIGEIACRRRIMQPGSRLSKYATQRLKKNTYVQMFSKNRLVRLLLQLLRHQRAHCFKNLELYSKTVFTSHSGWYCM